MQDRIGAIEAAFVRRRAELDAWHMRELAKAFSKFDAQVSRYAVGTNQFHVDYGMSACTAAAAAAALYFLAYIATDGSVVTNDVMTALPWVDIVNVGTTLWCEYSTSPSGRRNNMGHVEFRELLACGGDHCDLVSRALTVIDEAAGHTDDAIVDAMDPDALPQTLAGVIDALPARSAVIITATSADVHGDGRGGACASMTQNSIVRGYHIDISGGVGASLVVLCLNETPPENDNVFAGDAYAYAYADPAPRETAAQFWIYDSHGGVDTGKAALLCGCTTAAAAADVLREQLPMGLFSATVVMHTPMAKERLAAQPYAEL